ncbi:MAG: hypothetical protein QNK37_13325 [Acidobacteriota bacterium]|nr:hypothetical protein [Acidobacteriota bacterium]
MQEDFSGTDLPQITVGAEIEATNRARRACLGIKMPVAALGTFITDLKNGLPELGHNLLTRKTDPPRAVTTFFVFGSFSLPPCKFCAKGLPHNMRALPGF